MGLFENIQNEPVRRLALRDPAVVGESDTVHSAVERMREKNLGCAVVVNNNREPMGLFSESELTRLLSEGSVFLNKNIKDYLRKDWPTVKLTDPISCVLDALESANIRFLIVIDENGQLAGLTGQKGLMEYVADHFPQQTIVNRIGCNPYPAEREGA